MVVSGAVNGTAFEPAKADINVTRRGWKWTEDVKIRWAESECDDVSSLWKPSGAYWGAVVSDMCTGGFSNRGDDSFAVKEGTGPWERLFYVSARNAPVAVSAMLAPVLTDDGSKHPLPDSLAEHCESGVTEANEWKLNTECLDVQGYKDLVKDAWDHEQGHLNDFAKVVMDSDYDIYAAWDALAAAESAVITAAKEAADDAHDEMVRLGALRDTGALPGWLFWLYTGGAWSWGVHR